MLTDMLEKVTNKENFRSLENYIDFSSYFLEYIEKNKQAVIVSQNENAYKFFQYGEDVDYRITRPFNSDLLYNIELFENSIKTFESMLKDIKKYRSEVVIEDSNIINRCVYTIQQSIGFGLDALPAGQSNKARKVNGDLFENLILLLLNEIGVNSRSGVVKVPIKDDEGNRLFDMNYQHDIIVNNTDSEFPQLIGSVKTTSKDRIAKVFMDKFLYNKLTEQNTPHIAVFLHDVQRANGKKEGEYKISQTFLRGHFKGYTLKLNPLDGVYYFDMRPVFYEDELLIGRIKTFDEFLLHDVWNFI